MRKVILTIFFVAAMSPVAVAQEHHHHGGHDAAPHAAHKSDALMPNMAGTQKTAADRALYDVSVAMMKNMDVKLVGTPDADFVRTMIPHHQGAIDMASVVQKYGHDKRALWLSGNIIKAQTWEISWMNRWLERHAQPSAADVGFGLGMMERSADNDAKRELLAIHHGMHAAMDVKLTGDADVDFIRAMIPHHQGAIDMAYWVLKYGRNDETKKLAREIIKAQRGEIAWMRAWLAKHTSSKHKGCKCHAKAKNK
jgi:uncharacterized protein (DUF305 family)